ncbi:MAG: hypothetical protein K8T91_25295 [Planctomycetes bacterium]|nr:hypothetical protein [Planctomycetota bacterium]
MTHRPWLSSVPRLQHLVLWPLVAFVVGFTIITQLPPRIFNYHDDFEKYFGHSVRMLETGTLFGSPLSALGMETLGGQAVLHGVVSNHFPLEYINGVDAVFGLFLCLTLVMSMVPRASWGLPASVVALMAVFAINPQYVNVSALYLTSALTLAVFILSIPAWDEPVLIGNPPPLPSPMLLGITYAAMLALKSTNAIFPAVHGPLLTIGVLMAGAGWKQSLLWACKTAGCLIVFLSPWLLLHLPHYLASGSGGAPVPPPHVAFAKETIDLLDPTQLFYGGSYAHYTLLAGVALLSAWGLLLWRRPLGRFDSRQRLVPLLVAATTVAGVYVILVPWLGPLGYGHGSHLRYAIPFLIAGAPGLLALSLLHRACAPGKLYRPSLAGVPALLLGLVVVGCFLPGAIERMRLAWNAGTTLAWLRQRPAEGIVAYCDDVQRGNVSARLRIAQQKIPPGASVMVWVMAPYHLDYRRNLILDAEPAGIATPWARFPECQYLIIEYRGPVVRLRQEFESRLRLDARRERANGWRCLAFLDMVQRLIGNSEVLANDGGIAVLKRKGELREEPF